jgi:hypothetical protein
MRTFILLILTVIISSSVFSQKIEKAEYSSSSEIKLTLSENNTDLSNNLLYAWLDTGENLVYAESVKYIGNNVLLLVFTEGVQNKSIEYSINFYSSETGVLKEKI